MITGMDIRHEAFKPVGGELYRTPQHFRQRNGGHFVRINMDLDAKGAADILAEYPHLRLLEAEMLGEDVLHHMRRLRPLIDRKARLAFVPIRDNSPGLKRDAGMAPKDELSLNHLGCRCEGGVDLAGIETALKGKIVAERRMNDGCLGIECFRHTGDGL